MVPITCKVDIYFLDRAIEYVIEFNFALLNITVA